MTARRLRETVGLTIVESEPRWEPAARLRLPPLMGDRTWLRVRAVEETPAVATRFAAHRAEVVLLVGTADNLHATLLATRRLRAAPGVAVAAALAGPLAGQGFDSVADALREAGAVIVLRSPLEIPRLARPILRHTDRVAARLDDESTARQSVWRRLPWQPAAPPLR